MCRLSSSPPEGTLDVLAEEDARARAARLSEISYDVDLALQRGLDSYHGKAVVRFRLAGEDGNLRLDFRCDDVRRLVLNGRPVPQQGFDGSRIVLPGPLLQAGPNEVEVEYESAFSHSGNGFHRFVDPADGCEYAYTDFEPFFAHRLMPCFDQPDLKAVLRLTVEAPASWTVVSNNPVRESVQQGDRVRHDFVPTPPVSTYLFFVAAGNFLAFEDEQATIPSRLLVRRSMADYVPAGELFELVRAGLQFFQGYFGCSYPFLKYDQVFVPEMNLGAMENPGSVSINELFLYRRQPTRKERQRRADVILHEMSHMWFGDLVTMRWWDGLWLNESFATYVSHVAMAQATEFTEAFQEFLLTLKQWAYWQDQLPTTHPVAGAVRDTNTAASNFDGITYGKGAALLSQLAFFLGPDAFQEGLRRYFERHAWGNTDLGDFFAALGDAAGRDLGDWSRVHLRTSGVNSLVPHVTVANGRISSCSVEQLAGNGDGILRPQRLEVAHYVSGSDGSLELHKAVGLDLVGERSDVAELAGAPEPVFLWANHGDHAYARTFLDPKSFEFVRFGLDSIQDGLTRRGVWLTFWEMVRDGLMEPVAFLDTFERFAPREKDLGIVQTMSRVVVRTLTEYLPLSRDAWSERIHWLSWWELNSAAAGSDAQKIWLDLVIDTGATSSALEHLESLSDGRATLPSFELDPERRWKMVVRLCAFGRPGARGRVSDQLARDGTDIGRRQALKAEASLPDPALKQRMWNQFVEDTSSSLEALRTAMDGFHWPHQADLSRAFVEPFFAVLPELRRSREHEFADAVAEHLFPKYVFEPAVLQRSRAFLATHPDLPDDVRKPLLNANDELARALRIRAA